MSQIVEQPDWENLIHRDGVYATLYNDEQIYQKEVEKIWRNTWVYVGHESEVPNKNDFVMKYIGPEKVIMTRDAQGQIHLLVNRCTHRGNEICSKEHGNAGSFTCPYHAWTFKNNGALMGQAFPDGFQNVSKDELGLDKVTRVDSYQGFVFGKFSAEGPSLEEHLGGAKDALDRLVQNSPSGEIEISAGFLKHKVDCNWKLLVENETDGYHPGFVHASVFKVMESRINELYGNTSISVSRDYGNGHTEIDLRPEFRERDEPMSWFGASVEKLPEYVAKMNAAYGEEKARQIMIDGSPHIMIFPNLFIAEIQMFVIQPLGVDQSVQHVTAIQYKDSPEINRRLRQQTMGSVGPAGFLLADDCEMYERTHSALKQSTKGYTYIGRGDHRERRDENGYLIGDSTDDLPSRGIWNHYRNLMEVEK